MPSVAQVSRPSDFTPLTSLATFSMSRSFGPRQAAPMQKRVAPASLARRAASITASSAISGVASTGVSKWTDCGQ